MDLDKYVHLKDLEKVFDSFSSGIFISDELGFFIIANYYSCKILNLNKTDIAGKNICDIELISNEELKKIIEDIDPTTSSSIVTSSGKVWVAPDFAQTLGANPVQQRYNIRKQIQTELKRE